MPQTYVNDDKKTVGFKFKEFSLKSMDLLLTTYQDSLSELEKISNNPESFITDSYGVCNNRYKMRYITPHNIVDFVSYLGRVVNEAPFPVENVNDMEIMSVAMLQRFVNDNESCVPFEDTNAYGTNAYIDQRTITLSKLLVMCRNEFYDTGVYSRYDMAERANAIKPDLMTLKKINFSLNTRKLIVNIPKVLVENCPVLQFDAKKQRLISEIVTRFIETAIAINLSTIEQMMAYVIPRSSYNIKFDTKNPNKRMDYDYYNESGHIVIKEREEDNIVMLSDGIVTESVNLSKCKPVFINLSEGGDNFVSNTIKKVTKEEYSHSSISFDPELNKMYTFNGGFFHDNVYNWQKPGFQLEALRSSKFQGVRCTVYCVFVPNAVFDRMLKAAHDMEQAGAKYDYKAIIDRWKAINSGDPNANPRKGDSKTRQICSSFVNSIIAISGKPMSDKELVSPGEIGKEAMVKPNEVFKIYDGPGENYDPTVAMDKIKEYANKAESKAFAESVYTECCLLKTNDIRIRSKIPFNCNMRDIVLQDMRPDFKDTESALMFMLSDERSPITSLLRKYRTIGKVQPTYRVLNMFMHLRHAYGQGFDDKVSDPYYLHNEIGKMHTDPNWLDKIAYGNQFLDGNYRADALGNNKFTPMENTLNHLYSMYCGCGLKTNEELANHIIEIANVMKSIIHEYNTKVDGCVCNYEMMRDILATFGEILTRSMLKLYDNNTRIFTVSDEMDNAAAPSYMYIESFDMYMEANGPSITVDKTKTGMAKAWGNIQQVIRKFLDWISRVWGSIVNKFTAAHQAELKWINDHEDLNNKIGQALDSGFTINLNNYIPYKISFQKGKMGFGSINSKEAVENFTNAGKTPNALDIISEIAKQLDPEISKQIGAPEAKSNFKEYAEKIVNVILYQNPSPKAAEATKLDKTTWDGMVSDLKAAPKAIEEGVKLLSTDMKTCLEDINKKADEAKKKQNQSDANGDKTDEQKETPTKESYHTTMNGSVFVETKVTVQPQPTPPASPASPPASPKTGGDAPTDQQSTSGDAQQQQQPNSGDSSQVDWPNVLTSYQQVTTAVHNNLINALQNKFYNSQYKLYRDIVTAYNSQYEEKPKEASASTGDTSQNTEDVNK